MKATVRHPAHWAVECVARDVLAIGVGVRCLLSVEALGLVFSSLLLFLLAKVPFSFGSFHCFCPPCLRLVFVAALFGTPSPCLKRFVGGRERGGERGDLCPRGRLSSAVPVLSRSGDG